MRYKGTRISKLGNLLQIRDPIKKRWQETGIIKTEVAPCSFTVLTSSSTLL